MNVQQISHEDALTLLEQHSPEQGDFFVIGAAIYVKCRDDEGKEFVVFTAADGSAGIINV